MKDGDTRLRLWAARGLIGTGLVCLLWCGVVIGHAHAWQREKRAVVDRLRQTASAERVDVGAAMPIRGGAPLGELEVPRLHLSAVIVEGDDETALKVAVGHLPDTPFPWETGNTAMAAHRDTFFRPLKDVRVGDVVRVRTPHGEFEYRVRNILIVNPDDVWVLDSAEHPTLTLITCYPFWYVGHAPQRFVVRAERET